MSPALIDALLDVRQRAHEAGHGGKDAVYAAACQQLGLSRATKALPPETWTPASLAAIRRR